MPAEAELKGTAHRGRGEPPADGQRPRLIPCGVTRNVAVLGLVSLCTDLSSVTLGQLAASVIVGALWHVRVLDGALMPALTIGAAAALVAVPILALSPTRVGASPGVGLTRQP